MKAFLLILAFSPIWESPIRLDKPVDQRPFLIRLVCSVGLAFEVGAEKARLKVDSRGAELGGSTREALTVHDLFPTGAAVTVKFGTDF